MTNQLPLTPAPTSNVRPHGRPEESEPRATCYQCFRPRALCYCADLVSIRNQTKVVIVQHPRERFHPLGTARIVERSLQKVEVIRALPAALGPLLRDILSDPNIAIVYPGAQAEALEKMPQGKYPQSIIVVDGTWHHAKTILRDVPELRQVRQVRFTPPRPSEYRIRREPHQHFLSTLESVAHVLQLLEPNLLGLEALRETFRRMIDRNLALRSPQDLNVRMASRSKRRAHRFPEALSQQRPSLVSFYCEGTGVRPKEPLLVCAQRPGEKKSLRILLRTERPAPGRILKHLALEQADFDRHALSHASARERIEEWLQPQDAIAVCHAASYRILQEIGVSPRRSVELKGAYCDFLRYLLTHPEAAPELVRAPGENTWGGLEEVLVRHQIPWLPTETGRGAARLAQTVALLDWIKKQQAAHLQLYQ